jgi:hypothetical protein
MEQQLEGDANDSEAGKIAKARTGRLVALSR